MAGHVREIGIGRVVEDKAVWGILANLGEFAEAQGAELLTIPGELPPGTPPSIRHINQNQLSIATGHGKRPPDLQDPFKDVQTAQDIVDCATTSPLFDPRTGESLEVDIEPRLLVEWNERKERFIIVAAMKPLRSETYNDALLVGEHHCLRNRLGTFATLTSRASKGGPRDKIQLANITAGAGGSEPQNVNRQLSAFREAQRTHSLPPRLRLSALQVVRYTL